MFFFWPFQISFEAEREMTNVGRFWCWCLDLGLGLGLLGSDILSWHVLVFVNAALNERLITLVVADLGGKKQCCCRVYLVPLYPYPASHASET